MACNLLSLSRRDLFLEAAFDNIRSFVLSGGDPDRFVVFNTKPVDISAHGRAMGPLDHLIVVRGHVRTSAVEALVALYGHIQFSVFLGHATFDRSFAMSYRVDQLASTDRLDHRRDLKLTVRDFVKVAAMSSASRCHFVKLGMHRVLRFVMQRHKQQSLDEMIKRSWDETIGAPNGKPVSEEKHQAFCELLATRFVRYVEAKGQLESIVAKLDAQGRLPH